MKKFNSKNILIAGMTGSGKSNFLHTMILDLLNENSPHDLRLILIDPKMVEFSLYDGIPHLLTDVITKTDKARNAFRWLWGESFRRLRVMEELNCSSVQKYNKLKYAKNKLPKLYVFVDEFSDLMADDKKFYEEYFRKITALSGLTEIYLVISTSRPDPKNVVTKNVLGCFSTRIAFRTATEKDSAVVIGKEGAEQLPEKGFFLLRELSSFEIKKLELSVVEEDELKKDLDAIKHKYADFKKEEQEKEEEYSGKNDDDLYPYAVEIAKENGRISASLIQRKLRVGYARSARLLDLLEENGLVESASGVTPRKYIGG